MTDQTPDASLVPAFHLSPVPAPGPDAVAPAPSREIYGMPMFVTVQTTDLAATTEFWTRGLGFIDLFSVPGALTHLRRWRFQDALLVPAAAPSPDGGPRISFSAVLAQLDEIRDACEELAPGCTSGPRETPWRTVDLDVRTPGGPTVTMTAARALRGGEADALAARGFLRPDA